MVVDFGLNDGPSDIEDVADDDDAAPTARNSSGSGIEDWLAEYPEVRRMILVRVLVHFLKKFNHCTGRD